VDPEEKTHKIKEETLQHPHQTKIKPPTTSPINTER